MATYKIPYQNISVDVPDEGVVFAGPPGHEGSVYMRQGMNIITLPVEQYTGDLSKLPTINPTSEGIQMLQRAGGKYQVGSAGQFISPTVKTGETITQSISPENPYGMDVKSSVYGDIYKSGSLQQNLMAGGATPTQASQLTGQATPAGINITPEMKAQITSQAIEQGVTQVVQGQQGYGASGYTGVSIVDYLSSLGKPTDFSSRTALANQMGIQNYTGTAEQNTQLLNKLRGQGEISQSAPSGDISTKTLESGTTPIQAPTGGVTGANTPSSIVAGAETTMKSIEDYIKMLTPPTTSDQTSYDSILKELEGLIPSLGGRGAAQSRYLAAGGFRT